MSASSAAPASSQTTLRGGAPRISDAIVRVYARFSGRGPTRARTEIGRSVVTVVLEDTLTVGERKLVELGHTELVRDMRRKLQDAMRAELVIAVESSLQREVVALLSDHQPVPDIAVETFVLGPSEIPSTDDHQAAAEPA